MMKKKPTLYFVIALVVLVTGAAGYNFILKRFPANVADRLCDYVRDQQKMNCVTILAADTFVHPGSIVNYQPSETPALDRLPLPVADIMGPSCLIPGTPELANSIGVPHDVSLPQFTFETNGNLKEGLDVDLPKLSATTIKAGPQWSAAQKVDVTVDKAWVTQLDEMVAR